MAMSWKTAGSSWMATPPACATTKTSRNFIWASAILAGAATATSSITGAASAGSCSGCLQDCCVASCHDCGRDMDVSQLVINSVSETCAYGGGRGNVDAKPCRACAGQGSVFVAQLARPCVQCQGRGES